jgi:SRSO17 transposase
MSASSSAPGAQQQRFAAYLESLARAAGRLDRAVPLESYCTGLLPPGERKSIEPMAARLAPGDVQRMHQSLHHFVANAPWSDEALLEKVRHFVLPVDETKRIRGGLDCRGARSMTHARNRSIAELRVT